MYTYDLGDQFQHLITCNKVFSSAESTGRVAVLGGAMRCPNEDGNGNDRYQEEVLDELDNPAALAAACRARSRSMNCKNGRFDPHEFDVAARQAAVDEAMGSKASSGAGCKKFVHHLGGVPCAADMSLPGPGQKAAPKVQGLEGLVESINVRPDRKEERLCAACGSPHNLSVGPNLTQALALARSTQLRRPPPRVPPPARGRCGCVETSWCCPRPGVDQSVSGPM